MGAGRAMWGAAVNMGGQRAVWAVSGQYGGGAGNMAWSNVDQPPTAILCEPGTSGLRARSTMYRWSAIVTNQYEIYFGPITSARGASRVISICVACGASGLGAGAMNCFRLSSATDPRASHARSG